MDFFFEGRKNGLVLKEKEKSYEERPIRSWVCVLVERWRPIREEACPGVSCPVEIESSSSSDQDPPAEDSPSVRVRVCFSDCEANYCIWFW
jgi:hypothetical protein